MVYLVKNLPAMCKTWVLSLGLEDPLEKGKDTHSSILAWRIPGTGVAKSWTRLSEFRLDQVCPLLTTCAWLLLGDSVTNSNKKEMILSFIFLTYCVNFHFCSGRHLSKQVYVNLSKAEFSEVSASQQKGMGYTKIRTFPEFLFVKYPSLLRLKPNKEGDSPIIDMGLKHTVRIQNK